MATYVELYDLLVQESELKNKIAVAVAVAAGAINSEADTEPNHANRLVWAKQAFQAPLGKAEEFMPALVAANKDAAIANIRTATDAAIQSQVDAVIDLFADGG